MDKLFNAMLLLLTLFTEIALLCSCQNASFSCLQGERQALLKLKESFSDSSHCLSSWKGKNCCMWKGVSCDENNGHVVKLNLRAGSTSWFVNGSSLRAPEVNSYITELRYLKYLDLSGNDFQDSAIPQFFGLMKQLSTEHRGSTLGLDHVQWISHLASLQQLGMAGIHLGEARNLFQVLNMLPSLQSLHLSHCGIHNFHFSRLPINSTFHGSLQRLDLRDNDLGGPVPIALQNMTSLRVLDLSYNRFNSSIPNWFGNFKNLIHLNLAGNDFSSTKKGLALILGNMCYLKSLDLSFNQFQDEIIGIYGNVSGCVGHDLETLNLDNSMISGHIPERLGMLKHLKHLHLSGNQLNGTIPESLGQLSSLKTLDLSGNQLNGVISESLGQLCNLDTLDLSYNSLEGAISEVHFATLSKLKVLSISSNSLTIKIKSNWVPPFQLEYIEMGSCKFGTQFPQWLRTQLKATTLVLSNNSISGILPKWIKELNLSLLDLSHNQITGSIPKLSSNLMTIDLSNNLISGTLTEMIGDNNVLPKLHILVLSDNRVNGSIPNSFCHIETLEVLQLSKNKLSANIPDCWRDYQSLQVLDLSSNNLSGAIPSSIGHLNSLQWLHLSNNNLSGEPPLALKNCRDLVVLDLGENALSGHVPKWIGDGLWQLSVLRLRKNKFSGTIPPLLCQISTLQILDLAENNLKGRIPYCFGDFIGMVKTDVGDLWGYAVSISAQWDNEHLTEVIKGRSLEYTKTLRFLVSMDLSSNKLEGSIPGELTLLTGLIGLNLSHNQFSGKFPNKIGELESLESLDLSFNELSGMIPGSVSSLTKLSYLNLSYNNFSGKIPEGNQLQTLDDPFIYAGNPLLCGPPLKKCWDDEHHQGKKGNAKHNPAEKMWFYIVIMSGYATGFWGVVAALIFKKSWRHAYFLFVDKCKDWVLVLVALKMASVKNLIKGNRTDE
ncbi:probable inactive leucine-rich repeat receptor kinase XIAO isoform X2 [Herrania umbratica]|uniref:Probable inactive leucine-rich repeat receptor kinase XIAO isoform X2 n=1 Tax=Herrania umbratica TaxID=108875 RepID=A0A6J1AT30_9ROSI|nr:probable inactive leucine-rich repeat receptor kinase XIAO isoform X2 [Herrania umbratica]